MRKLVFAAMIILTATVQAQDTGNAAVDASSAGTGNSWDKWMFTGGFFAAVAGGVITLCVAGPNGSTVADPFTVPTSH